jgi:hypothetical protein
LVLTSITTLLDGLCLTFFKHVSSSILVIESGVLALSAVNCVALVVAILLWVTGAKRDDIRFYGWRRHVHCIVVVYMAVATGITAGGVAWSMSQLVMASKRMPLTPRQHLLMVTRSVVWTLSVLSQGLLGGLLLMMLLAKEASRSRGSSSLSHELDSLREHLVVDYRQESTESQLIVDSRKHSIEQKKSCDGLVAAQPSTSSAASSISKRYSGRTLYQHDSKHGSLELHPQLTYPEFVVMRNKSDGCLNEHDVYTVGADGDTGSHKLQDFRCSLDTLRRQSSVRRSTDTSNSLQPEAPCRSGPAKLNLADESNIHPLFRSNSPTPPPTAMPGTTVIASPAAGQTISIKALHRMRSTNSLRSYTPRSRSPLFERIDQADQEMGKKQGAGDSQRGLNSDQSCAIPSFLMAADLRRSITQYERKYVLIESPHES